MNHYHIAEIQAICLLVIKVICFQYSNAVLFVFVNFPFDGDILTFLIIVKPRPNRVIASLGFQAEFCLFLRYVSVQSIVFCFRVSLQTAVSLYPHARSKGIIVIGGVSLHLKRVIKLRLMELAQK